MTRLFFFFFCLLCNYSVIAQPSFTGLEHFFTTPRHYVVCYTTECPNIDGNIADPMWEKAVWSEPFRDIEGDLKPEPPLLTRMKMVWDDKYLYIAAELEEPHIWAYLQNHDDIVYHDNDFEVFIDPGNNSHQYFEIEVNAHNTIFDLFMPKAYRNGSGALVSWNAPGLKSAVHIYGTLNNPSDIDKYWTVEMAIPFTSITMYGSKVLPCDGRIWRINFSRVNWHTEIVNGKYINRKDVTGKKLREENWVWSPQGVINMHYPERWGYLLFSAKTKPSEVPHFIMPYNEKQRQYLWLVYYRQKEYFEKKQKYASSIAELGIKPAIFEIDNKKNTLSMEATSTQFSAIIESADSSISINDEGFTKVLSYESHTK